MIIRRKIIEIDEERCNGCGQCILDCAEGALVIVDGKAKVISDNLCDGLGACLKACPQDALHIIERDAVPFDEQAVAQRNATATHAKHECHGHSHGHEHGHGNGHGHGHHGCCHEKAAAAKGETSFANARLGCGCPGSATAHLPTAQGFKNWPVKLRLIPPTAPFLQGASLVIVADCAPAVYPNFAQMAKDKIVCTLCPKFENTEELTHKLTQMLASAPPADIIAMRMEVPCCKGLESVVANAHNAAKCSCSVSNVCMGRNGMIVE